ncbi:glycoside hydrolase [Actinomadura logoneensis]|uniref:Glycoside hydrolase n=1 Tax=Actinomadura logoneensis TaxID=2293572 RepID=A0A372JJD5_9ACTN|nr:family 43 glycosylhydrolase [Actinomadura logoneensis]RFU40131.1 glycoside hydrolase [Actinomadura logoneensis]
MRSLEDPPAPSRRVTDRPLAVLVLGALVSALITLVGTLVSEGGGSAESARRVGPGASSAARSATASPAPSAPADQGPPGPPTTPLIDSNFPDPAVIRTADGYHAFATNDGGRNIPMAEAPSATGPWTRTGSDALPALPAWAEGGRTWAPDVSARPDGSYLLYFTAQDRASRKQCLGVAVAGSVAGPYTPASDTPLVCRAGRDTIDPAAFVDTDGTRYLLYKQEGGERDPGGLWVQRLTPDGLAGTGAAVRVLTKSTAEPELVEAPALVRRDGKYVLFYAAGVFHSSEYQTRYAIAPSIAGPYTRGTRALLTTTGYRGRITGPGGADVVHDGTDSHLVFHGILRAPGADPLVRAMYMADLGWANGTPVVRGSAVRYEAESSRLTGVAVRRKVAGASGGATVGTLDRPGKSVELDIYAPTAGEYQARVGYVNRGPGPAALAALVNGASPVPLALPADRSHGFHDATAAVTLRTGWNVIRLTASTGSADLDWLEVS